MIIELVGRDPVETTHFPSVYLLAKAIGKKAGSVNWYEKTKRPMPVDGSETVVSGDYIISRP